nr:MAG TPA: SULFITE REDUCTASE ALPHA SUBUNIT [Bacteriophage sp.]
MTIEYRHGHYVVLDDNGNVYCSCDTHKEAADEIAEMEGAK